MLCRKKMTRFFWVFTSLLIATNCYSQIEQLEKYKNLYTTIDSLNKLGQPFLVDSLTVKKVKILDNQHPAYYFAEVGNLLIHLKFNDAAFAYYLGMLRFRYYNLENPEYHSYGDGAMAVSLQYGMGEPVNFYLKTNIDNFRSALQFSSRYFAENDYTFFSKKKDPEKYDSLIVIYSDMIKDLETNREKYQKKWADERETLIESINKSIKEYNDMTPEQKEKLKNNH